MTDRIAKLAEQHGFIHEFMTTGERNDALQKYKKFAELIVRECIGIIDEEGSHEGGSIRSMEAIKQHFGVEE